MKSAEVHEGDARAGGAERLQGAAGAYCDAAPGRDRDYRGVRRPLPAAEVPTEATAAGARRLRVTDGARPPAHAGNHGNAV